MCNKKSINARGMLRKRRVCLVAILINFGILVVLKYSNFLIDTVNGFFNAIDVTYDIHNVSFVLPLGISFYTFQAIGYLIDVYRKKYPAEESFFRFALFLSYFPHIIQGPFSRFDDLGKTLFTQHKFSYERLCEGSRRILWGFFKKLLIADNIAIVVNEIFSNYGNYIGPQMLAVAFFYGIQIYADFSGYMDIVCGISHILGVDLTENFKQPYFSKSIDEFWRRWHITLGRWFRDYLFYPVAMSKKTQKIARKAREKLGQSVGRLIPRLLRTVFCLDCHGFMAWGCLDVFDMGIF